MLAATATGVQASQTFSVQVGENDVLNFQPNQVTAAVGDTVVFEFHALNHTITQSSLDSPCVARSGFDSGFRQYNAADSPDMKVAFTVNSPEPEFFFCRQSMPESHCALGMVFALNAGDQIEAFWNKVVNIGPLSSLVTSLGPETVTFTSSGSVVTTTLSNLAIPNIVLTELTSLSIPNVVLTGPVSSQSAAASSTSAFSSESITTAIVNPTDTLSTLLTGSTLILPTSMVTGDGLTTSVPATVGAPASTAATLIAGSVQQVKDDGYSSRVMFSPRSLGEDVTGMPIPHNIKLPSGTATLSAHSVMLALCLTSALALVIIWTGGGFPGFN
jgi:plastocyanin